MLGQNDNEKNDMSAETKNLTVLVTGGAGFIGSELCRQLQPQVARLLIVDNLMNGKIDNIAPVISAGAEFHRLDIRNVEALEVLLLGIDVVFHLACLGVRHSIHSPLESHEVNATATLTLLAACQRSGVGRCVYVSTSEVYGTAQWAPMSEDHPTSPMTVYGAAKLAGESYARAFYRTYDYPTVVIRPFNSFGPRCHHEGDSGEVIPKFLLRALAGKPLIVHGDGSQTRDFTYVSDTARGILLAGFSEAALGQTINIGQGKEITINELAQRVGEILGRNTQVVHAEPRPGDVLRLFAQSARARELLGFTPAYSLAEGLQCLKSWYEQQPSSVEQLLQHEVVKNWHDQRTG